jgi:repressor LexA
MSQRSSGKLPTLTGRQAAILRFIADRQRCGSPPPSIREIGREFGIRSSNGVACHLRVLQAKGFLIREPGSRALRVRRLRPRLHWLGKIG